MDHCCRYHDLETFPRSLFTHSKHPRFVPSIFLATLVDPVLGGIVDDTIITNAGDFLYVVVNAGNQILLKLL